jgi:hypothetical protein
MKTTLELTTEQEAQAQELATRVTEAIAADVLQMARLLVSKDTRHTFGKTEFQLRDLVHKAGAKALETSLAQKKRLPGLDRDLPEVPAGSGVQGLPTHQGAEPAG